MKKKIAILGSTGSIGQNLLKIIEKDKTNFDILLLTANTDYKLLFKQAKKFKVKNLIIKDKKSFEILKKKLSNSNINIFNNYENFNIIFKKKNYRIQTLIFLIIMKILILFLKKK